MPPTGVHFNGSVNLPDTESVFRTLLAHVPKGVRRLPDGETGPRAVWIGFQLARLLETPGLERVDPDRVTRYAGGRPSTRLDPGVDPDSIAWPDLGYATSYQNSYATFARLRDEGIVPPEMRFQVEYPTPRAVMSFVDAADRAAVEPSYERALLADLDVLLAAVPHTELAVQWDIAHEIREIETGIASTRAVADRVTAHADHVPDAVPVGVHLCYGDFGHQHFMQPRSLQTQVELANAVADRVRRPLGWISFTVPQDRSDREYFAPLADLHVQPETELYLALVPYEPRRQATGTTDAQIALVDKYIGARPWGVCTECGLGRVEADDVPDLLDRHREILAAFG